jgi:hypothetical protein
MLDTAGSTDHRNDLGASARISLIYEVDVDDGPSVDGATRVGPTAAREGLSLREIGRQVGCSHEIVRTVVRRESKRPVRSDSWLPGPGRLRLADREEISLGLRAGVSFTAIAIRLGKAVSTVSREVAGNGGRNDYRAWRAHQQARERARRPKAPKLGCARLAAQVTQWLYECGRPRRSPVGCGWSTPTIR